MKCAHPNLTEIDNLVAVEISIEGQEGGVTGAFQYKKYRCERCKALITILHAVVENEEN